MCYILRKRMNGNRLFQTVVTDLFAQCLPADTFAEDIQFPVGMSPVDDSPRINQSVKSFLIGEASDRYYAVHLARTALGNDEFCEIGNNAHMRCFALCFSIRLRKRYHHSIAAFFYLSETSACVPFISQVFKEPHLEIICKVDKVSRPM